MDKSILNYGARRHKYHSDRPLSSEGIKSLKRYVYAHEDDILNGINDFGELNGVLHDLIEDEHNVVFPKEI